MQKHISEIVKMPRKEKREFLYSEKGGLLFEYLYNKKGYSTTRIGKKLKVSRKKIHDMFNFHNIKMRTISETHKKFPEMMRRATKRRLQTLKNNPDIMKGLHEKRKQTLKDNPDIMMEAMKKRKQTYKDNPDILKRAGRKISTKWKKYPEIIKRANEKRKQTLKNNPDIMKRIIKKGKQTLKDNPDIMKRQANTLKQTLKDNPDIMKRIKIARAKQILPKKDTLIEIKIQNFLSLLHIEFITHKYMSEITHSYQCDILIPKQRLINQKTIIECDGCYWHGCKICVKKDLNKHQRSKKYRDNIRTKELKEKGFRVIRLWEYKIKYMKLNNFKQKLEKC